MAEEKSLIKGKVIRYEHEDISPDSVISCFDVIDNGVFILDKDGTYLYANNGLTRMAGGPGKQRIIGTNVHTTSTQSDILIFDIVKKEKLPYTTIQDIYETFSGFKYRQLITQYPILDEYGEIKYVIGIASKLSSLNESLKKAQERKLLQYSRDIPGRAGGAKPELIAESPQMKQLLNVINMLADVDAPILVYGESGVGKEVIVKLVHEKSKRRDKPIVDVNCAALPENLLEAELFGYEKGAFTGADERGKIGLMESASGGFLFLDEINSMSLQVQGKLLRALETKTIRRIGGNKNIPIDLRIISASNVNLENLCKEKKFREDLYYRLNVIPVNIPPLRERKADILPLAELFLKDFGDMYGRRKTLSLKAQQQFLDYSWPGNIRELKNLVERIVVTTDESVVEIQNLNESMFNYINEENTPIQNMKEPASNDACSEFEGLTLSQYIEKCEKKMLEYALDISDSSYEAAKILGLNQSTVVRKRQKYGL